MARGLQFCIQHDFTRQPPSRPETHLKSAQQGNVSEERLSNHGKAEETCKTIGKPEEAEVHNSRKERH